MDYDIAFCYWGLPRAVKYTHENQTKMIYEKQEKSIKNTLENNEKIQYYVNEIIKEKCTDMINYIESLKKQNSELNNELICKNEIIQKLLFKINDTNININI